LEGILNILEPEVKHNSSAVDMIKFGRAALKNGHEIIKELLELRELEEKPLSLQLETVNLKRIVEEIVAEHSPYADQKQIELKADAPDVQVQMDKQLLKRLITNLVSNAIKFSEKGKPVSIQAKSKDSKVIFEVIDEGPGFNPADIEKMYAKFQRLSARPTGGESSHGLGLAIVDLLVKRLGATIDLKTESGKGSAFTITVPVSS
jgi:signal transduction histidine kinase